MSSRLKLLLPLPTRPKKIQHTHRQIRSGVAQGLGIFYTHLICPESPQAIKATGQDKLGTGEEPPKQTRPNPTNHMLIQNDSLPVRQNGFKS